MIVIRHELDPSLPLDKIDVDPSSFQFDDVDTDDVVTFKALISEAVTLPVLKDKKPPPNFGEIEETIMGLAENRSEVSFSMSRVAVRGLADLLKGFHDCTEERVSDLIRVSNAYPHNIRAWRDRRVFGKQAKVILNKVDEVYPADQREFDNQLNAPTVNREEVHKPERQLTLGSPETPVEPASKDQPAQ